MRDEFTTRLMPGQALTVAASGSARRLVVTGGRLWLTVSGATDDHWLQAGQGFTVAAGAEVVIEGWPQAEFQLLLPPPVRQRAAKPARCWRVVPAAA